MTDETCDTQMYYIKINRKKEMGPTQKFEMKRNKIKRKDVKQKGMFYRKGTIKQTFKIIEVRQT